MTSKERMVGGERDPLPPSSHSQCTSWEGKASTAGEALKVRWWAGKTAASPMVPWLWGFKQVRYTDGDTRRGWAEHSGREQSSPVLGWDTDQVSWAERIQM